GDGDGFHRRACPAGREMLAPAAVEAAVGRCQRRNRDVAIGKPGYPGSVGTESRPTATAQGEDHGIGLQRQLGIGLSGTDSIVALPGERDAQRSGMARIEGYDLPGPPASAVEDRAC